MIVRDSQPVEARDNRRRFFLPALLVAPALTLAACSGGSDDDDDGPAPENLTASLVYWNGVAVDCSGLDHSPTDADHTFGEQLGPCRAGRAMAIVHIAIFEAMNAIEGGYDSYLDIPRTTEPTSIRAAIAQAGRDSLVALFPSQTALLDAKLDDELALIADGPAKTNGIELGTTCAETILELRENDGSDHPEPVVGVDYIPSGLPGAWSSDPISGGTRALGANWDQVDPFVLTSADQFRLIPPPDLDSAEYALAYNEVIVVGGDGDNTPTLRTEDQTFAGIFWAYDGTPSLCAPPRLYNQVANQIAVQEGTTGMELARLLVLLNISMAEGGLASWESKYFYAFWRPVTAIRGASTDGNDATYEDANFHPLGAPASNLLGPNFTPPFPAYPSGHATFGGTLFQTLRRFYGTDEIEFTFVSDEYNGVTLDNEGNPRPYIPRTFANFTEAEEENGQSRMYLGIHWNFDKVEGIEQGNHVANWVFEHVYAPEP